MKFSINDHKIATQYWWEDTKRVAQECECLLNGLWLQRFFSFIILVPHHTYMENFGNRANFRLPVFGGFTVLGSGESKKHKRVLVFVS